MKTITIMAFAATAFVFSACSNDKNDDLNNPVDNTAPVAAQFTAGIVTRAFDQQWDANDLIAVTGTSGDIEYQNINYQTIAGDGVFSAETAGEEIYFQDPAVTSFTAYYPSAAGTSGTLTPLLIASTENQKVQKTFDFLHGTGTGSKANPMVTFQFGHSMSKCIFNIKPGVDITFADITGGSCTLTGVNHFGEFDTSTGVAATTGADVGSWDMSAEATASDVTLPVGSEVRTYSLILYPQTMAGLTYRAVIDGQPYTATIAAALVIEAGNSYSYNITVNKTGLSISKATIAEWEVGNGTGGTDVDAEM